MSTYNADGQINTTVVNGSTFVGHYAADGSWNIVTNDGSTGGFLGHIHSSGAYNAVIVTDPGSNYYASNGSINVIANNFSGYSPVQPAGTSNISSWVLSGATVDMDFANNRYFGGTTSNLISITRASNATDLLPSSTSGYAYNTYSSNVLSISPTFGLLIFEARTNLLLNSTIPATQTTGSLGTGNYTIWVNGSGTAIVTAATAVGTGFGTASQGSPITFNISSAGTVLVTVVGSLNAFQLEAGVFGTSFIVTAGATTTRAADNISAAGAFLALFTGSPPISIVAQTNQIASAGFGSARILGNNGNGTMLFANSSTAVASYDGVTVLSATCGTGGPAGVVKSGASQQSGTGRTVVCNNGTVATDASPTTLNVGRVGSNGGSSNFMNGHLQRITGWNTRLSDPVLKAFTV